MMLSKVKKSRVFVYKPNDFTVESLDVFLALLFPTLRDRKVLILGAGNIGSKVALKLCERGAHVLLYDRDILKTEVITTGLNLIKRSNASIESVEKLNQIRNIDIVLGCTPGIKIINENIIRGINKAGKIIDVGNGTIEPDAILLARKLGIEVFSLSSFGGYKGLIENWLFQRKFFEKKRVRLIGSNCLIIPGVLGKKGDIIVNDVDHPSRIIGICDGNGDVIAKEKSHQIFMDVLEKIEDKELSFQIKNLYSIM